MSDTKIIATLGPASWSSDGISALASAGVDVFRLNCSHSSLEALQALIRRVRESAPHAGVLVDLQGPKLRLADVTAELVLGQVVTIGRHADITVNFDPLALGVLPGHRILIDDGHVCISVTDVATDALRGVVTTPGKLKPRKGVNLPDTFVTTSPLTEKDILDAHTAVAAGVDWLALSFVQHPSDVTALRDLTNSRVRILAKVERPQVLGHLDELCRVADGVMAARGDLGVELPFEQVPLIQNQILAASLRAGAVSVCATEMLESMIYSNRPTRAEASDVATAVRDGFDAVMLSAETATGIDPVAAVTAMSSLCRTYEGHVRSPFADEHPETAAVTAAAAALASRIGARTIMSLTSTGYSASLLAACRPPAAILAVSPSQLVCRQLQLRRGVTTLQVERPNDIQLAAKVALAAAREAGLVEANERIVLCASRQSPRSDADSVWLVTAPS
jgi:pyruvate kinase